MAADSKRVDVRDEVLSQPVEIRVGTVIDGKFEILGLLGRGGFASVYSARQASLNRVVAIKVLDPTRQGERDPEAIARFAQEARAAALIDHPNIVTVFDTGTLGVGQPYIAMKLVDGHDLKNELDKGAMSVVRALRLFDGPLAALARAHELGIVHRDLKPSNLLLSQPGTPDEQLLVVDFGIARINYEVTSELTSTNQVLGSLGYIAPEYLATQTVSPALDVYQMGLILSEAVSGCRAFAGPDIQRIHRIMQGEAVLDPALMETELGKVILKAIHFDPGKRWRDAGAFRDALQALDPATIDYDASGAAEALQTPVAVPLPSAPSYESMETLDTLGGMQTKPAPVQEDSVSLSMSASGPVAAAMRDSESAVGGHEASAATDELAPPVRKRGTMTLALGAAGLLTVAVGVGVWIGAGGTSGAPSDPVPPPPTAGSPTEAAPVVTDGAGAEPALPTPEVDTGEAPTSVAIVVAQNDAGTAPEAEKQAPPAAPMGGLTVLARKKHTVLIDGVELGRGPVREHPLTAGEHKVEVRRADGQKVLEKTVTIVAGKVEKIRAHTAAHAAPRKPEQAGETPKAQGGAADTSAGRGEKTLEEITSIPVGERKKKVTNLAEGLKSKE